MKVTAWKTVEVECECDVEIDDILTEFGERVDESDADYWRRMLPVVDVMTRILARIKSDTIATVHPEARATVSQRLAAEAERWAQ